MIATMKPATNAWYEEMVCTHTEMCGLEYVDAVCTCMHKQTLAVLYTHTSLCAFLTSTFLYVSTWLYTCKHKGMPALMHMHAHMQT